jgi:glycosyltransferase involved in cell wall biosynthesis
MKVLAINKFLHSAGGAESVFFQTNDLLRHHGVEVATFGTASVDNLPSVWDRFYPPSRDYNGRAGFARARDAAAAIYSPSARRGIRRMLREFRPDVAHLHNIYHQLSLSIVDELDAAGVPMVMTVHDYKPICPNYTLLTHDGPCTRCLGGSYWNAVMHRCLKGSIRGSAVAAIEAYVSRVRHEYDKIQAFVAPSEFSRGMLVSGGLPNSKVHVARNAVDAVDDPAAAEGEPARFVYCGRLSHEKGLHTLLSAIRLLTRGSVHIYGDGPLAEPLARRVQDEQLRAELHGRIPADAVSDVLRGATSALLPSLCHETGARAITEAGAVGVPTIATAMGAATELVDSGRDGVLVAAGDSEGLAAAMNDLANDPTRARAMGRAAWSRVRRDHRPQRYLEWLLRLFDDVRAKAYAA